MRKPDGYDEAKSSTFIPDGAYEILIIDAGEVEVEGKKKLKIKFDIADGDFKGYYSNKYKYQLKHPWENHKVEWKGTFYTPTEGKGVYLLTKLIDAIEKSNPPFHFEFKDNSEKSLKGKRLGLIFKADSFKNQKGEIVHFVRKTPITLDDLKAKTNTATQGEKNTQNSNENDDLFVENVDELDIPF